MSSSILDVITLVLLVTLAAGFLWLARVRLRAESTARNASFLAIHNRIDAKAQILEGCLVGFENRLSELEDRTRVRNEELINNAVADLSKELRGRFEEQLQFSGARLSKLGTRFEEIMKRVEEKETRSSEAIGELNYFLSEGVMAQLTVSHAIGDTLEVMTRAAEENVAGLEVALEKVSAALESELTERNQLISDQKVRLEERNDEVSNLKTGLEKRNQEILDQRTQLKEYSVRFARQQGQIEDQIEKITKLGQFEELSRERLERVHDLQDQVRDLQDRLKSYAEALDRSSDEVEAQAEQIQGRTERISDMESALEKRNQEILDQRTQLKEYSVRFARQQGQIEDQIEKITKLGQFEELSRERLERVHDLQDRVHDLQDRLKGHAEALDRSSDKVEAQAEQIQGRTERISDLEFALETAESKMTGLRELDTIAEQVRSELTNIRDETGLLLKNGLEVTSEQLKAITGWISSLSHDLGGSRRELARLTAGSPESSIHPRSGLPKLVVVSGPMRSGTTLAGELLYSRALYKARHPQISFANDVADDIREFSAYLRAKTDPPQRRMDPAYEIPFDMDQIARFYDPAGTDIEHFSFELIMRIRQGAPLDARPVYYGVKQTDLLQEPALLARIFPDVRTIFMVRDPRAIYSSYKQRDINIYKKESVTKRQRSYFYFSILISLGDYSQYLFSGTAHNKDDYFLLKYEDLVLDTESSIKEILAYLKLDSTLYDWSSLRECQLMTNSSYAGNASIEPILNTGVSLDSLEAFRNRISPFETYVVERLSSVMMDELGYAKTFRNRRKDFEKRLQEKVIPALRRHADDMGYAAEFLDEFEQSG